MTTPRDSAAPPSFHMEVTLAGRAALFARAIGSFPTTAVLFTTRPGALQASLDHVMPGSHVLALDGTSEPAEWDLRLAELMANVYRAAAIDIRLLWDGQLVIALHRWSPRVVGIELAGIESAGLYEPWTTHLLLQRVREILPAARLVVVSQPEGRQARERLERLIGTTAVAPSRILPAGVALRVTQVGTERQRRRELIDIASGREGPLVVVTPTRARAVTALGRLGSAAMAYHGGLLDSERASALEAFRRRNLRALVTTQLLPPFDDLPAPAAIVLTHPPHRAELVPRLGAWLAGAAVPGPLFILWSRSDTAGDRGSGPGARPNLADLRGAYRAVRSFARDGYARVVPDSVAEAVTHPSVLPYLATSCLAALELAGYMRREDDMGRLATVTVSASDEAPRAASALPPWQSGAPLTIDPLTTALKRRIEPTPWQRRLLEADLDGLLSYRPAGRERLYRLIAPDRGAASRLQLMVRERANAVAKERQAVLRGLEVPGCRVQALALLLELPPVPKCGLCDQCAPEVGNAASAGGEPWHIALRALAEVPLAVPERAAARIARQALSAAGLDMGSGESGALIDFLVAQGLVRRESGDFQPRLVVSNEGWARLTGK